MDNLVSKKTIIITGSNGYIGNALIKRLSKKYNVIGLDQKIPKESLAASHLEVNISSFESISRALEKVKQQYGNKIASVIHLAAYYSFADQESAEYEKITVKGTESFLKLLKHFEVDQFIFSSTMLVHKPVEIGEKINEDSPVSPTWAYPKSKIDAEKILKEQHEFIPLINIRIAGVYDDHCHSIPIANQIMRIYERHFSGRLYPGNASKGQSFLHLDDLVDAIEKIIERRKILPPHVDLILGEPKAISYADLQNKISNLLHKRDWNSLKVPLWFAKIGSWLQHHTPLIRKPFIMPWMIEFTNDHYELDISRAHKLIEWTPNHEVAKTIPLMIEALKKNPLQFYKENKLKEPSSFARLLGRMPGDDKGFELPSVNYLNQLNVLNLLNILWGLWLLFDSVARTTSSAMMISSIVSGFLVIILSLLAYTFLWHWPRWVSSIIGLWILFAPLVFWSNSAADYSGGNLTGLLIVLCGAIKPSKLEVILPSYLEKPNNWDYNPSSWRQRMPIITLAFFGFFIARYMAAFQLGHINSVWDPFFGKQTETILMSDISKSFPISDAGLGAYSYLLDAISGMIGDRHRWRTMPWIVIVFGLMIIPPGVTSIVLVILQPVAVNAWCFLCLLTALIMLLMVGPAFDEVVACVQFLYASHKKGRPFWRTFLQGIPLSEQEINEAPPANIEKEWKNKLKPHIPAGLLWCLLLSTVLMFMPWLLNILRPVSNFIYISAALIFTFTIIAMSEIARPLRILNLFFGTFLLVGVWPLDGADLQVKLIISLISISILMLSLPKGKFRHHFGDYDKLARWSPFRGATQE